MNTIITVEEFIILIKPVNKINFEVKTGSQTFDLLEHTKDIFFKKTKNY